MTTVVMLQIVTVELLLRLIKFKENYIESDCINLVKPKGLNFLKLSSPMPSIWPTTEPFSARFSRLCVYSSLAV